MTIGVNAFDYMVLGRMIYFFAPSHKVFNIAAPILAAAFVAFGKTCFACQPCWGQFLANNWAFSFPKTSSHS